MMRFMDAPQPILAEPQRGEAESSASDATCATRRNEPRLP
jgi:hypothetical protein